MCPKAGVSGSKTELFALSFQGFPLVLQQIRIITGSELQK
jgi:hypothetical protein